MGRPLNSKFFGDHAATLPVTFFNGIAVTTGYIVKQTGTNRFLVTENGVKMFSVDLVRTAEDATEEKLKDGFAYIEVETEAGVDFVSRIWSKQIVTVSGMTATWDMEEDSQGTSELVIKPLVRDGAMPNASVSKGALRKDGYVLMGNEMPASPYQLFRSNEHDLEIGLQLHQRAGAGLGLSTGLIGGVYNIGCPAAGFVSPKRANWSVAFSLLHMKYNQDAPTLDLNDFKFTLTVIDQKSGNKVKLTRESDSSWKDEDGVVYIVEDEKLVEQGGDAATVDQNSINLGWETFEKALFTVKGEDTVVPAPPKEPIYDEDGVEIPQEPDEPTIVAGEEKFDENWASEKRKFSFELEAKKGKKIVGNVRMAVEADPMGSWSFYQ